uniref:hypothetical protein n=1 Tax=Halobaculum sp. P14 TaxID=3421638 RepID=UPI003EB931E3
MDRIDFLGFVLLLRDISRLDRYSTRHFIAVSNAIAAILLYRWVRDGAGPNMPSGEGAGLLAALIFLSALPIADGMRVNARSPMLVGVLFAVRANKPEYRGSALAAGALCSQYAIFGAPVLAYQTLRERGWEGVVRYTIAGILTVVVAFLPLLVIWGWPSLIGGIENGLLSQYRPLTEQPVRNIFVNPRGWAVGVFFLSQFLLFEVILTVSAIAIHIHRTWTGSREWYSLPIVLTLIYTLPLFVKTMGYYVLHVLPFAAVVSVGVIASLIQIRDE